MSTTEGDFSNVKEKIYFFFDYLVKTIFGLKVDFVVENHRSIKNGYVILLPVSGEGISHLIGRQGRVINALNVIISQWAYRNNVIVYIKQKREKDKGEENSK